MYINYVNDRKSLGYKCLLDTQCGNRLVLITDSNVVFVKNVTLNLNGKTKRIVVVVSLATVVWFSNLESVSAMGLPMPSAPVVRVQPNFEDSLKNPDIGKLVLPKPDRIIYKYFSKSKEELLLLIYSTDPRLASNQQILKLVKDLRGGSWGLIGTAALLGVMILIFSIGGEGFVINNPNPSWGLGNNLYEPLGLVRPADCETQLYAGSPQQSLKTEASRNQPNPKDRLILVESRPELIMRRGQAQFKTKDHGALAGLPYKIKKNGGTSTARTEENIDRFMDVVEEIVENPNSIWFEDGTYQGGTNREVESINIYNEEENRVAIFKRSTGEFMTFCEPNDDEREDLLETGNFGGPFGWFSGQTKNVPPKVKAEQNVADEITPIDSFESHVMGITPAPAYEFSSIDEGQNPGFTPLNSFESDVMGITPLDSSSSDYQI